MPDPYTQIPLQVKPPSLSDSLAPFNTLLDMQSKTVGIQQQKQALQTGQYIQQGAQAEAQQQTMDLQERQAANGIMAKFGNGGYRNPDGTPDWSGIINDMSAVAPKVGPGKIQDAIKSYTDSTNSSKALNELDMAQRTNVSDALQAQNGKSLPEINQFLDSLQKKNPSLSTTVQYARDQYKNALDTLDEHDPDKSHPEWRQAAVDDVTNRLGRHVQGAPTQQQMLTPDTNTLSTGAGGGTFTGMKPFTGNAPGTPVPSSFWTAQPAPGTPTVNQQGTPGVMGPAAVGAGMAPGVPSWWRQGTPGAPPPAAPAGAPQPVTAGAPGGRGFIPTGLAPGQAGTLEANAKFAQDARAAADQGNLSRNQASQILGLIPKTNPGPGSQWAASVAAALHLPAGDAYQELNKFLEQRALTAMSAMGAPSNDRLNAALLATGTTQYDPEALKAVTKWTDAVNTGLMGFRNGLDRAIGTGANQRNDLVNDFRQKWANNFDLDVYRLRDAKRRGDTDEIGKIQSEIVGENARRAATGQESRTAELQRKSAALTSLENSGQ